MTSATLCTADAKKRQPHARVTGVSPVSSHRRFAHASTLQIRQGAYLPHWTRDGGIYAVTFRLADSLPHDVLEAWRARTRGDRRECARRQDRALTPNRDCSDFDDLYSERDRAGFSTAATAHAGLQTRRHRATRRRRAAAFRRRAISPAGVVHHAEPRARRSFSRVRASNCRRSCIRGSRARAKQANKLLGRTGRVLAGRVLRSSHPRRRGSGACSRVRLVESRRAG